MPGGLFLCLSVCYNVFEKGEDEMGKYKDMIPEFEAEDEILSFYSISDYHKFISYACSTCDTFSLNDDREYFAENMYIKEKRKYKKVLHLLRPYQVRYEYMKDGHSECTGTSYRDTYIRHYRCCLETEAILQRKESVFDWELCNNLPEELCFYRGDQCWYYTITHEEMDGFENYTKEDAQALIESGAVDCSGEEWNEDDFIEFAGGYVRKAEIESISEILGRDVLEEICEAEKDYLMNEE